MNTNKLQWFQDGAQAGTNSGEAILVDNLGNIYVIGWAKGSIEIQGRENVDDTSKIRLYVSKFAGNGYLHWLKTFVHVDSPRTVVATLDNDQNVIIAFIDNKTIQILKISTYGKLLWTKQIHGQTLSESFHNVRLTADTNVYISGAFEGVIRTDDNMRGTSFVAKINPQGEWDWTKSLPGKIGPLALVDKMITMCTIDDNQVHLCTMDKDNFSANIYVIDNINFTNVHDIVINKNNDIIVIGSRKGYKNSEEARVVEAVMISPNGQSQLINTINNLTVPVFISLQNILINDKLYTFVRTENKTHVYQNQYLWLVIEDHPTVGYPSIQNYDDSILLTGSYMMHLSINHEDNITTIQGHENPSFYAALLQLPTPPVVETKSMPEYKNITTNFIPDYNYPPPPMPFYNLPPQGQW